MLLAEAGCVFMGFILFMSGVQGQQQSICALKGSSVDLPCSAQRPTANMTWFTVHRDDSNSNSTDIRGEFSAESNFTLTIKNLTESDANVYCCTDADDTELCWGNKTELRVADLQVKVIPSTEGQTVTLMCSTSCPLTEHPAGYIWYKNREFLYQDWSPWYQQLVSSEEAVTYSCAVRGYEDLRAPEVSVDSVTPTCFNVTYAKGRTCPHNQTSEDERCSITYPRDVHLQSSPGTDNSVILTCNTSCWMSDPQTAFIWSWDRKLYRHCESQDITVFSPARVIVSCAVKGHEDLRSDEICLVGQNCLRVNYVSRRLCALEGSSVNISSEYTPSTAYKYLWNKVQRRGEEDAETLTEDAGRVEFRDDVKNYHTLRISNLKKNDSAEYTFRLQSHNRGWEESALPGVTLVVTGLKVTIRPSAEVTEGQRVTLTCSTSCPLPDNTNYIWFFNSRPLTLRDTQNKQLVLEPVRSRHAGNYSCAVESPQNITSSEEDLTVNGLKSIMILNVIKLVILFLLLSVFPVYLIRSRRRRRRKTSRTSAKRRDKVQTAQDSLYESIRINKTMKPAARTGPAEQQEDTE